ncbi:hypothetical protein MHU86_7280 [Fragilaria crotonensis]|nr:hypothetical protein MHU86_7280 [Fragilaria crotonensis]
MIYNESLTGNASANISRAATKWRRKHKASLVFRLFKSAWKKISATIRAVGDAIASSATNQQRRRKGKQNGVRKGASSGKGFNKRNIQTSAWHRTAATVCLLATAGTATGTRFDSDSVIIHVDNCASRCISNSLADFVKPPQKVIGRIKGMGGDKVAVTGVGTIRWTIDDDMGTAHSKEGRLSGAERVMASNILRSRHAGLGTKKFSKKIPFDKSNVATFTTTPGCKNFRLFRACLEATDDDEIDVCECVAFDATIIEDDEDDEVTEQQSEYHEDDASIEPVPQTLHQGPSVQIQMAADDQEEQGYTKTTGHHDTSYDAYKNVAVVEDVEEDSFAGKLTATAELLLWHYRLGHVPFSRLVNMAKEGCSRNV